MAAVVAVFLVPILFFRLFTPMQYLPGVLLTGVRSSLCVTLRSLTCARVGL